MPQGTRELDLFIANNAPGGGNTTDWAVAGLKPTLTGIPEGTLPAGAILGHNGKGKTSYSICPPKGKPALFGVALYALTRHVPVKPGFKGVTLLNSFEHEPNMAEIILTYTRP